MTMKPVIAIDIGGTKIAAGIVGPEGAVLWRGRIPTWVERGPEDAVARLLELVAEGARRCDLTIGSDVVVGIGCAGPLDPVEGLVRSPPNLSTWVDYPIVSRLTDALGATVILENDANAAALGEHRFGAGVGSAHLVYVTLSTGIGAGAICDGRLVRGANGNAAELGHVSIAWDGRTCGCGNRGCLEAYASGTAIAERARERLRHGGLSVLAQVPCAELSSEHVVEAVRKGDALATALWDETMEILGAGIANMINAYNPERVVVGGGLMAAGELLLGPVRAIAKERALAPLAKVAEIIPAKLGPDVGLLGAAAVALDARQGSASS